MWVELCPTEIRFIHNTINNRFGRRDDWLSLDRRGHTGYVNDAIENITRGRMDVYDLPKIRIVQLEERNNYYYAFDNRRLYVYRVLHYRGLLNKVKVNLVSSNLFQPGRFNTRNNGRSIRLQSGTTLPHSETISPPPSPTPSADDPSTSSTLDVEEPVSEAVAAAVTFILESVLAACGDEESQTSTDSSDIGQEISVPAVRVLNSAEAIDLKTVMEGGREDATQPNEEDTSFDISQQDSPCSSNNKRSFDPESEANEDHKRFKVA